MLCGACCEGYGACGNAYHARAGRWHAKKNIALPPMVSYSQQQWRVSVPFGKRSCLLSSDEFLPARHETDLYVNTVPAIVGGGCTAAVFVRLQYYRATYLSWPNNAFFVRKNKHKKTYFEVSSTVPYIHTFSLLYTEYFKCCFLAYVIFFLCVFCFGDFFFFLYTESDI